MDAMASQITSLAIVDSTVYSDAGKKTSKLRVIGLCASKSLVSGEFPAWRASNEENAFIWLHQHDNYELIILWDFLHEMIIGLWEHDAHIWILHWTKETLHTLHMQEVGGEYNVCLLERIVRFISGSRYILSRLGRPASHLIAARNRRVNPVAKWARRNESLVTSMHTVAQTPRQAREAVSAMKVSMATGSTVHVSNFHCIKIIQDWF